MTTGTAGTYPLKVEGDLAPNLNRGLWLVKWLLLVPHIVALVFLAVAFVGLTVVAFLAILFTGRYPRALFDFNVGVLRWSWRVGFYSYSALGTDRYPPFSLGEEPDYPTQLHVTYPRELSRGLVLVKWWLLALPHYLVVSVFTGGAWAAINASNWLWAGGLSGLLVLFAGLALLTTGHEPLGAARRGLRRAHDRRLPAVPPRHGPARGGPRRRAGLRPPPRAEARLMLVRLAACDRQQGGASTRRPSGPRGVKRSCG
jgi:hypothetical protein